MAYMARSSFCPGPTARNFCCNSTRSIWTEKQSRVQKTCVLLKLEGIDTVEAASALRDKVVSIARADAKLPEGSLFIADLLGLPVYDGETLLGTLAEVMPTPANDVYVVKSEDGQEHLIPSVPDFVLERNLDEGYIRVRLIEGM